MSTLVRQSVVFFHDADVVDRTPRSLGPLADALEVEVPAYPGLEGAVDSLDGAWKKWDSAADLAHHFHSTVLMGRGPIDVIGAGLGGWVALELALMSPEAVRSLVLVAPYGVKLFDRVTPDFADILLLDAHEQVELGWADPQRVRGMRMPGFPKELPDEQHELAFAERATLARYIWKPFLHSPRLSRWVQSINVPTLVLAGSDDRMLREGHSRRLAELMPHAAYQEIADAGHYPYLEQPEAFGAAVQQFYTDLEEKP
jgi:pimeloyl-ACP methyl ester carboxylesterase